MKIAAALLSACLAAPAAAGEVPPPAALFPAEVPHDRPVMTELTAGLRSRVRTLGLNGITVSSRTVSRALLLLPADRARAGVLSFEIEAGADAGVWQCEALGRGLTYPAPAEGLAKGLIGEATVYYIPYDKPDGATVPGVYDLRNITPEDYEIELLGRAEDPAAEADIVPSTGGAPKPHFTAVWRHWYSRVAPGLPVDMRWAYGFQEGTQGEGVPVFARERRPATDAERARDAAQLAHDPGYFRGPFGRSGFAVHTDRWEDGERRSAEKYTGRPELYDFRYRDTNGCVKLRPGCLAVFNEFVREQARLSRRVQLEVREVKPGDRR